MKWKIMIWWDTDKAPRRATLTNSLDRSPVTICVVLVSKRVNPATIKLCPDDAFFRSINRMPFG